MTRAIQCLCALLLPLILTASLKAGQSQSPATSGDKDKKKEKSGSDEADKAEKIKGGFTGEMPFRISQVFTTDTKHEQSAQVLQVNLKPVDQTVGDVGPLEMSLRNISQGIEMPMGFFKVYETPVSPENMKSSTGIPERRFMRANGGLVALYNRSQYTPTEEGIIPEIPDSTVWVIGGVPLAHEPGHGMLLPFDPLNPSALPEQAFTQQLAPSGRVSGNQVGFGSAPDSMWRAESQEETTSKLTKEENALPCRFLEDRTYRKERLEVLIKQALR